jgi:hypothetical protein
MYKRGRCRCDECKKAYADYRKPTTRSVPKVEAPTQFLEGFDESLPQQFWRAWDRKVAHAIYTGELVIDEGGFGSR